MIVPTSELHSWRGRVSMVDGGFDPLHDGHVEYFAAAAALGLPVLCNVSPDAWVQRKHAVMLSQDKRGRVIDAFRDVALVHLSAIETVAVLAELRPRWFVKGRDWADRLPEREAETCREHGIEPVFVDAALDSSSRIVAAFLERARELGGP